MSEPQYIPVQTMLRRIQHAVTSGQITKVALSTLSRVPRTTLIGIESADWDPRASTVSRLFPVIYRGIAAHKGGRRRKGDAKPSQKGLPRGRKSAYRGR